MFTLAAFTGWTNDPHGFDRLLALLLLWPFAVGFLARRVVFLLDRGWSEKGAGGYGRLVATPVLGLPVAIAPYGLTPGGL